MRRRRQLPQGVPRGVQAATGHALRAVSRQSEGPHLIRPPGQQLYSHCSYCQGSGLSRYIYLQIQMASEVTSDL